MERRYSGFFIGLPSALNTPSITLPFHQLFRLDTSFPTYLTLKQVHVLGPGSQAFGKKVQYPFPFHGGERCDYKEPVAE